MATPADRVPKAQRLRLHRLKNAYRKAYRREPQFERPVTEGTAEAIASLEEALRQVGVTLQEESADKNAIRGKRTRRRSTHPGSAARGS